VVEPLLGTGSDLAGGNASAAGALSAATAAHFCPYGHLMKLLHRRTEILQRVFDSSLDAISISRLRDGRYIEVNEGFLRSGYTREQVIGRTDRELEVWANPLDFACFATALQRDGHVYNMETSFRLPDDTIVPALISARIVEVQGEPCVVAFTRGIARLKEIQRQLEEAREAALAASRAKSEFLATISHEIRTPMNAILGATELLQETELAAQQRGYLDIIDSNGHALLDLLNSVLDVAKIESGKMSLNAVDFDLPVLTAETANALKIRADEKGIALKVRIHRDVPRLLKGDPLRLRQVLTNLIGNAIKFTERGEVIVGLEPTGGVENAKICFHFSVSDTGIGIAADTLNDIFAPFTQADSSITRRYGGSGLGLTIVQHIVELMGGHVWAESVLGQGSEFHFNVSLELGASAMIQGVARERTPSCGSNDASFAVFSGNLRRPPDSLAPSNIRLRILLADDSLDNRLLLRAFLRSTPYQLDEADNGASAVDKFKAGFYDLVLMDIQMPTLDGYSAVRLIREWEEAHQRRRTPIIALTAHTLDEAVKAAQQAGCDMHLSKPLRKATLLRSIEMMLEIG